MSGPELSDCCGAPVVVRGRTTQHWECTRCGEPCDASEPVFPPADRMPERAEEQQNQPDHQHHNPDRPQDRDLEQETEDQQDDAEDDHAAPLTSADHDAGPTMPSAVSPKNCWTRRTAAVVELPKTPSSVIAVMRPEMVPPPDARHQHLYPVHVEGTAGRVPGALLQDGQRVQEGLLPGGDVGEEIVSDEGCVKISPEGAGLVYCVPSMVLAVSAHEPGPQMCWPL